MARRPMPSLSGLRAFEAFARSGAMTRAADALGVTHGAVSRQIKTLEAQLGARLVTGPRHRLVLTPAGRDLAVALHAAFDMIAAALPGAEPAEELVVSCLGTFAMKWLIPRMPAFLDAHPGLRVRIVESHLPVEFGEDGVHAAIRIIEGPAGAGIRTQAFMAHHHGPVLSPALLERLGDDRSAAWTAPRLTSETYPEAWETWAVAAGAGVGPASQVRGFEHNSYMLEAAAAGLGVAVTPWTFAQADIERGRLIAPWGFAPVKARFVYLRPALAENRAAEAFGDWLIEEGRRNPAPPPGWLPLPAIG